MSLLYIHENIMLLVYERNKSWCDETIRQVFVDLEMLD